MTERRRILLIYTAMALLLVMVGMIQSWNVALNLVNLCLISALMSIGITMQWGYAGLVNFGVMGFVALGGLTAVIVSVPPVNEAWAAGGAQLMLGFGVMVATIAISVLIWRRTHSWRDHHRLRRYGVMILTLGIGYTIFRMIADPAIVAIELIEPAKTGYLGGFGLPITLSWVIGGGVAALVAWLIARIALGLRSDYLAIATLGVSEIIIYVLKNEDWLARGVKNINGLPRPVPYEVDLQRQEWLVDFATRNDISVINASSVIVKLLYASMFASVLLLVFWLAERALRSPWGRMMRAIRDNETAAEAMGKDVVRRHIQIFILGSAVLGIAGAMLVTLDSQLTPSAYMPLRYTFLIWVMVIVGGSGNNYGAVIGGFIVWFFWIEAEPLGQWLITHLTWALADDHPLKLHLLESAAHMRLMTMGLIMLLVLRFAPKGLIPETKR